MRGSESLSGGYRPAMEIWVNGRVHNLPGAMTLRQFLETLGLPTLESGVAVCVNGELVRKTEWERTALKPDDELEIVQATQGG
jgi:sulfur carrier protein